MNKNHILHVYHTVELHVNIVILLYNQKFSRREYKHQNEGSIDLWVEEFEDTAAVTAGVRIKLLKAPVKYLGALCMGHTVECHDQHYDVC